MFVPSLDLNSCVKHNPRIKSVKQKLTYRHPAGIALEKPDTVFLRDVLGFGSKVKHNSYDILKYPNEKRHVVDHVIETPIYYNGRHYRGILNEATNPAETTFYEDDIILSKIDYFMRKDPKHEYLWSITISWLNFSKAVLQRIEESGIVLNVLNRTATKDNFHAIISDLMRTDLYRILKPFSPKFKKEYENKQPKSVAPKSTEKTLDQFPKNLHKHIEYYTNRANYLYRNYVLSRKEEMLLLFGANNWFKGSGFT